MIIGSKNKGDWSEFYIMLHLIGTRNLYTADESLQKLENVYFPVKRVLRNDEKNENVDFVLEDIERVDIYLNESLVRKENGYSDEVEKYLFLGYSFAGVKPLVDFMKKMSTEERVSFVEKVVTGKLYALNEKGISFKLLVDLLASTILSLKKNIP